MRTILRSLSLAGVMTAGVLGLATPEAKAQVSINIGSGYGYGYGYGAYPVVPPPVVYARPPIVAIPPPYVVGRPYYGVPYRGYHGGYGYPHHGGYYGGYGPYRR